MFLASSHTSLLSHWTSQQTNIFIVQRGTPKYIWKNYNSSIIPRLTLLTETFIQTCNHSFTVLFTSLDTFSSASLTLFLFLFGPYFFNSLGTTYLVTFLNSWVSTPPSQLGWFQDAPAWVCQPSSLQYLCLHTPGSTFWSRSRLLPITHAQLITSCPFNLSVGQSCIHFYLSITHFKLSTSVSKKS